ncbi:hypothetical protein RDI58_014706 [Solanum bulbocastanum]|uniref:Uncharacterized protein n=1 Tax=Solanum bulbocastanum TaxID=147425 RepID=A0AAN8TIQ9_SOLBU
MLLNNSFYSILALESSLFFTCSTGQEIPIKLLVDMLCVKSLCMCIRLARTGFCLLFA